MNQNSLDAYKAIGAQIGKHHMAIYEALLAGGAQTAWQIARKTRWDSLHFGQEDEYLDTPQVFRRLSEMVKAGWIQKLDWVEPSPSGCNCSVYWVSTEETK